MRRRIVLHPGFPKTGTSALQRHVFMGVGDEATAYLGVADSGARGTDNRFLRWRREMTGRRPVWFRPRAGFDELLRSHHLRGKWARTLVMSDELLLGQPLREALRGRGVGGGSLDRVLERLRASLPRDASIDVLLTIRRQEDLVPSFVAQAAQLMPDARHRTLRHAIEVLEHPGSELRRLLSYDRTAARVADALGAEVTLLPLERLDRDADGYLSTLERLIGSAPLRTDVPVTNRRRGQANEWATSFSPLSSLVYRASMVVPLFPPEAMKRRIPFRDSPAPRAPGLILKRSESDREHLRDLFAASNARCQREQHIDLVGLGYSVAGDR